MVRTLIAGTAAVGALTLGTAGLAGAATTPPGRAPGAATVTGIRVLPAAQDRGQVATLERRVDARVPKAEAREARAKAAGRTKRADAIAAAHRAT